MIFFTRIALASLSLALLTGLLILRGPQTPNVTLIAQAPNGDDIPGSTLISMTFSRPVDQLSAEQHISIQPAVPGAFSWQGSTLSFRPSQPLAPDTAYRVTIGAGLRDGQGRVNSDPISWEFRTRGPQLLVIGTTPEGESALIRVQPDGSDPRTLLTMPDDMLGLSVAPDGNTAIISVLRDWVRSALILVDLNDGSTRLLVDDPQASADMPAWSSAQDFIAYVHQPILGDMPGQPRIWLAQPDGSSYGPLLSGESVGFAPAWSPDGSLLAFVNGIYADLGIYTFFSDSLHTLASGSGEPASWAPDGSALAYSAVLRNTPQAPLVIRRWDVADQQSRDLTNGRTSDHAPAWSPAGDLIAFVRIAEDPAANGIWVMAPDGSAQRQLTNSPMDLNPAWSPDSAQLALIRIGNANVASGLWVVDVASGAARKVLDGADAAIWLR